MLILISILLLNKINIVMTSQNKLKAFKESLVESELRKFFIEYLKSENLELEIAVIRTCSHYNALDVIDWYLKSAQFEYFISNNCTKSSTLNPQFSTNIFVFLEVEEIVEFLNQMDNCYLWSSRSNIFFIINNLVKNVNIIEDATKTIWSKNILNFVLVFVDRKVNIFSYNGFSNKILNFTKSTTDLFPNKLLDINGYTIKVGMFEDVPRNMKNVLGQWYGPDYDLLEAITFMLNATLQIVESSQDEHYDGLYSNVLNKTVDFSFIPSYRFDTLKQIDFSYPRKLENLVILVPKAEEIPHEKYLFMIFDYKIWITIVVTLLLISSVLKTIQQIIKRRSRSYFYYLVESWRSFIGTGGIPRFIQRETPVKFVLTIWMLVSVIISASFQCSFTSTFTKARYFKEINTLNDLKDKGIQIFCADYYKDYLLKVDSYGVAEQLVFVSDKKMFEFREGKNAGKVFFVEVFSRAVIVAKLYGYHIVKEPLATGYTVNYFQKNSPYLDEVHRCVLLDQEVGLSKKADEILIIPPDHDEKTMRSVNINFSHLKSAFLLLLIGYHLGLIVLICEIVIKKFKRNKNV